jgi:hypothetical protein
MRQEPNQVKAYSRAGARGDKNRNPAMRAPVVTPVAPGHTGSHLLNLSRMRHLTQVVTHGQVLNDHDPSCTCKCRHLMHVQVNTSR